MLLKQVDPKKSNHISKDEWIPNQERSGTNGNHQSDFIEHLPHYLSLFAATHNVNSLVLVLITKKVGYELLHYSLAAQLIILSQIT